MKLPRFALMIVLYCLSTPSIASTSMIDFISFSPSCLNIGISGYCFPDKVVLKHHLPVGFVEVVKSPGDSLFKKSEGELVTSVLGTMVSNGASESYNDRGFEVRVWAIPDQFRAIATAGISCVLCGNKAAAMPSSGQLSNSLNAASQAQSFKDWACGTGASKKLMGEAIKQLSPLFPLRYDTALDITNWRSGCRDMLRAPVSAVRCMGSEIIGDVTGAVGSAKDFVNDKIIGGKGEGGDSTVPRTSTEGTSPPANNLTDDQKHNLDENNDSFMNKDGSKVSELKDNATQVFDGIKGLFSNPADVCLGGWGPNFPRQYRVKSLTEPVAAAKVAFQALTLAKYDMNTFEFDVNKGTGRLQQVYPKLSGTCFKPGSSIIKTEQYVKPSKDGRYGFVWWVPVRCCKGISNLGECFSG